MTVGEKPELAPLVRVRQSREDWEALTRLAGGTGTTSADLTRSRVERLRALDGALEFRLGTDDGERRIVVHFGSGEPAPARCTLTLRAEDARRLQRGEMTPQAAFMQGLVKIAGDLAFAMQVGAALL
jgi:putative sterol carrier protein